MKSSEFRDNWKLLRRRIRSQWPEMSDHELDRIDGRPNRLYHALVQKYGISRDEAARQMWEFIQGARECDCDTVRSN